MIKDYENKRLKIRLNTPLRGLPEGVEKYIKVDENGIPHERYWRDRFKDAKTDNCIEVIKKK